MQADDVVRWGVLATGKIAHTFATDLRLVQGSRLAAVASRSLESAQRFALEHATEDHTPLAYGSYAELAADPDVDVVYVASPHALHLEHVRMLLEAGKPVLCEKPVTLNAAQAEELIDLARERGLFFMEAMWMACHPLVRHVRERVLAGDFGTPTQLVADLGWLVDLPPTDRMFAPELGGGALLDMGVYVLTFAQLFLGEPEQLGATAVLDEHGIDLNTAIVGRYPGGAVAALTTTMTGHSPRTATIATDLGLLEFPGPFHHPSQVIWTSYEGGRPQQPVKIDPPQPVVGAGYGNEAREVVRCLRAGELESPMVPHAQTLAVMRQLDELRGQLGIVYPGE
ncbi:gfo/Idh/MocA family oxidoreductase [Nocardioides mangrovicus]|uniref:Gfo/Idh/MocA family oxidoreductase n=1 Tax=Nocardioides mangrovicus TaxID=2478913 RepID=A0A3L8NYE9_9ACTN|nr:Gfo/Idh/MocA family oxidoreductase [Nocardioides mangrovicus]RLV47573.1 gfo/Idh/MocA family oxidoreductase [Nocardioides mangrovicus]